MGCERNLGVSLSLRHCTIAIALVTAAKKMDDAACHRRLLRSFRDRWLGLTLEEFRVSELQLIESERAVFHAPAASCHFSYKLQIILIFSVRESFILNRDKVEIPNV